MDHRLYFVLGDLAANIVVGAVAGWLCAMLIGVGWNMFVAMILAMVVGMVVATILFFPFAIFFGAMEIMLPAMMTGMVSGMAVGMWAAMETFESLEALRVGAVCGLVSLVFIWVVNNSLRGVKHYG